ncbi:MAG: hypothetical protein M1835_002890 [Candelina submexicana]|nr:MAG: hypothetical protein M1835_002890 [Candelina submexicana]
MRTPSIHHVLFNFFTILITLAFSARASRLEKRPFVGAGYNPDNDNRIGRNLHSPQQCVASFGRPVVSDCIAVIAYMETGEQATVYQSLLSDSVRTNARMPIDDHLTPADGQRGGDYVALPRVYSYKTCAIGISTVQRSDYSDDIAAKSVIRETGSRIVFDCLRSTRATIARPNPITGSTTQGPGIASGGWALAGEDLNLNVTVFFSHARRPSTEINSVEVRNDCLYRRLVETPSSAAPPCNNDDSGDSQMSDIESQGSTDQTIPNDDDDAALQAAGISTAMSGGTSAQQQQGVITVVEKPVYCRLKDVSMGGDAGCARGEHCLSLKQDWVPLMVGTVAKTVVEWGRCVLVQAGSGG